MAEPNAAWRGSNAGRMLFSATDRFVREKLRAVHESGFDAVTEAQLALFQNLDLHGTRLTTLSARAGMTKQAMLELVDKAEARGFVERQPDPDDRRAKTVVFTPAGMGMLDHLRRGVAVAEERMALATGAEFLAEFKARLTAYVDAGHRPAAPAGDLRMSWDNAAWRLESVGRVLISSTGRFTRDMLHVAHGNGAGSVAEVHLALFRNLDLGGTRLTEIAVRARMTKQAMLELVDKCEAHGFVERLPDPGDGRAKIVMFTPAGLQMLDCLRGGVAAAERRMAAATGHAFVASMKTRLAAYVRGANEMDGVSAVRQRQSVVA